MQLEVLDPSGHITLSRAVDALIFDLDGVVTQTARVHADAWKLTFDEFLNRWSKATGREEKPFDEVMDYRLYVDGRRRLDGVRTFLKSRGIQLPESSADGGTFHGTAEEFGDTIQSIGRRKNDLFLELLEKQGIQVFQDAVEILKEAKRLGVKTAVVTASRNCESILKRTRLTGCFDARVDGVIAAEKNLKGKPEPDTFLAAAQELRLHPVRAAVFEDALSGVQAAHKGGFGLVVGVARSGPEDELRRSSADQAIRSFEQIRFRPPAFASPGPYA